MHFPGYQDLADWTALALRCKVFLAQNHPVCLGLRRPRSGGGGGGDAAAGVCRGCRRVAVPPTFVTFPRLCVALGGRAARGRRRPGTRACRTRQAPHTRGYAAAMTEVGRRLEQGHRPRSGADGRVVTRPP